MEFKEFKNIENDFEALICQVNSIISNVERTKKQRRKKYEKIKYLSKKILEKNPDSLKHNFYYYVSIRKLNELNVNIGFYGSITGLEVLKKINESNPYKEILEKVVNQEPKELKEVFQKFICLIDLNRNDDAKKHFIQAIHSNKYIEDYEMDLLNILIKKQNGISVDISKEFRQNISIKYGDDFCNYINAKIKGDLNNSTKHLKKMLSIKSHNFFLNFFIGSIFFIEKFSRLSDLDLIDPNIQKALKSLQKCTGISNRDPVPYIFMMCYLIVVRDRRTYFSTDFHDKKEIEEMTGSVFSIFTLFFFNKMDFLNFAKCTLFSMRYSSDYIFNDLFFDHVTKYLIYFILFFSMDVFKKLGDYESALEIGINSIKKNSYYFSRSNILKDIGDIYFFDLKNYNRAIEYYSKAIEDCTNNEGGFTQTVLNKTYEIDIHLASAFQSWSFGNYEEAKNNFIKALETQKIFYKMTGEKQEAIDAEDDIARVLKLIDIDDKIRNLKTIKNSMIKINSLNKIENQLNELHYYSNLEKLDLGNLVECKKKIIRFLLKAEIENVLDFALIEEADLLMSKFNLKSLSKQIKILKKLKIETTKLAIENIDLDLLNGEITMEAFHEKIKTGMSEIVTRGLKVLREDISEVKKLIKKEKIEKKEEQELKRENCIFKLKNNRYEVEFRGKRCGLNKLVGIQYVAFLLAHPYKSFNVFDLHHITTGEKETADQILDDIDKEQLDSDLDLKSDEVLEEYRKLKEESDIAERSKNSELIIKISSRARKLERYSESKSFDFKSNPFYTKYSRRVNANYYKARTEIGNQHQKLESHIQKRIVTGYKYSYEPETSIEWLA